MLNYPQIEDFFMLDISEILDDEDFTEPVVFDHGTHETTNVQPASTTVLQRLAELERFKPTLQVFTKANFPLKEGDIMFYNDQKWRCVSGEDWSKYGYYDALFQLYSGAQDPDQPVPNPWD